MSSLLTTTGSSSKFTGFTAPFALDTLKEIAPFNSKQRGNGNCALAAPALSFPAPALAAMQLQVQLSPHAAAATAVLHQPASPQPTHECLDDHTSPSTQIRGVLPYHNNCRTH